MKLKISFLALSVTLLLFLFQLAAATAWADQFDDLISSQSPTPTPAGKPDSAVAERRNPQDQLEADLILSELDRIPTIQSIDPGVVLRHVSAAQISAVPVDVRGQMADPVALAGT